MVQIPWSESHPAGMGSLETRLQLIMTRGVQWIPDLRSRFANTLSNIGSVLFWKGRWLLYYRDPCSSELSAMNHNNIWSHRLPDPSVNRGNGFIILPDENKAVSASSSMAYHSNMPTSTINFASSSYSDLMNFGTSNLGLSCNAYLNYSSVRRSNLIPENYPYNGSYYNQHDNRGSTSTENTGNYQRLYFKRKSSGHSMALDVPNSNDYYNLRNSNGLSIPSDQNISNPNLGSHSWSHSSTNMLPGYPSNCPTTIGEISGFHRNVRSRHVHALQLENNLVGLHASGRLPPHFRPIASSSDNLAMSFMSHSRFPSQGLFHHDINQPIGSSGDNVMMEIADGYWSSLRTTRNTGTAVMTVPVIPTQDSINHMQRPDPYSSSRYTAMDDIRHLENVVLPRWRRHRIGQNDERYGRMRSLYDSLSYRINTVADEGHAHDRLNDQCSKQNMDA
ncbi:hypothetical protein KSP39_PZI018504 [Platanthera zijinensis]|uniref:Uncharacterized protein n=1 Tax=Platanthera zijinensis TaxID=2320716 RepID=A0AAP0B2U9_9ASPA